MTKENEATYQYLEEANGNGMFFYTKCCGNRMYSNNKDTMLYHGKLCPKCFTTLYLRGTPDGIRVAKAKLKRIRRKNNVKSNNM